MILLKCTCGRAMLFDSLDNVAYLECSACGKRVALKSLYSTANGQVPKIEDLFHQLETHSNPKIIDGEIRKLSNECNLDPRILIELSNIHLRRCAINNKPKDFSLCQEFCKITDPQADFDSIKESQTILNQQLKHLLEKKCQKPIVQQNVEVERLNKLLEEEKRKNEDLKELCAAKSREVDMLKSRLAKYETL